MIVIRTNTKTRNSVNTLAYDTEFNFLLNNCTEVTVSLENNRKPAAKLLGLLVRRPSITRFLTLLIIEIYEPQCGR